LMIALLSACLILSGQAASANAPNLVDNGDFGRISQGIPDNWEATGNREHVNQSLRRTIDEGTPCALLSCTRFDGGGPDDHAMIAQIGRVGLVAGKTYAFSCRARQRGMLGGAVSVAISDTSVWANCGLNLDLEVGSRWRAYHGFFKATRTVKATTRLQFWYTESGDLYLAEVRIAESSIPASRLTDVVVPSESRNLVPNGDFGLGEACWSTSGTTVGWGNDFARLIGRVQKGAGPGRLPFLRIPIGAPSTPDLGADYPRATMQPQTRLLAVNRRWVEVTPNAPYTLSCDLRADAKGIRTAIGYESMNAETGAEGIRSEFQHVTALADWTRFSFTFWPTQRYVCVEVGPDEAPGRTGSLDVTRIQLEAGREAGAFVAYSGVSVAVVPSTPTGVFAVGTKPALSVRLSVREGLRKPISLSLTVTDYFNRETALPNVKVSADRTEIGLPPSWRGWYCVRIASPQSAVRVLTPEVRVAIVPDVSGMDTFVGLNHAFADPYLIDVARKVGVSSYRDWSLKWNQTEPRKGVFDWFGADSQIERVLQRHAGVLPLLPPFPSAEWSSSAPNTMTRSDDMGDMVRQSWAPVDPGDLGRFVAEVVRRYKDRIHVWEFLNEPNYTGYSLPRPKYGPSDYVSLLKSTAVEMRKADPNCRIIGGSASDPGRLASEMFDLGLLDQIDILNLHMYPGLTAPEKFLPEMVKLRESMRQHGRSIPIWMTEFSYYGIDNPYREPFIPSGNAWGESRLLSSEARCAEFTVRFLALMLSQGVERFFIHAGTNASPNLPETECCLFDEGGVPRKVAAALAVMCSFLGPHPQPVSAAILHSGSYVTQLRVGDRVVALVWTIGEPVTLNIPIGIQCLDLMGNPLPGGSCRVGDAPIYLVTSLSRVATLRHCLESIGLQ
ncbi:MAG: hypothetical protein P4L46_17355, partial [Fimbriimonas sp.]|nr:hypothetical protein [Fimbriimonas sp.]